MTVHRRTSIRASGSILYLTEDPELLRLQLRGEPAAIDPITTSLLDNVSTDEITPAYACYYYDERLSQYCLVGLRGGHVERGAVIASGSSVLVSGRSKGCGSSRETAPYAEYHAGIRVIVARSFEKIYQQNCHNLGLLTTTDFGLIPRLSRGEEIPIEEFTRGLDPISAEIVTLGGLAAYGRARLAGEVVPPAPHTPSRPMTLCEKIVAAHVVRSSGVGVPAVAPSDGVFVRADVRFSHEYVTPMAWSVFREAFGDDAQLRDPGSVLLFRDHLTFLEQVMPEHHVREGLDVQARSLPVVQKEFAAKHGLALFGEVAGEGTDAGSETICHNKMVDDVALPGQIVVGTDSHTCMAGALGCLAFGVGATDMAVAWLTGDVRVRVPETVRIHLVGELGECVSTKDVMLSMLSLPFFREGHAIGKVLEFGGDGLRNLSIDERSTLTNMAVEAGGFTGIVEPDDRVVTHLVRERGLDEAAVRRTILRGDAGAEVAAELELSLSAVEPMVALPGDPRNAIPLRRLAEVLGHEVPIRIAYGGSCTGGKRADMDMYASVLGAAARRGERVAEGVKLYLQFGSQKIRAYAESSGYVKIFEAVGARLLGPACGACINAGPGVSTHPDDVTVSATNRNFPGRSGPGSVYLASPYVVAASALAGRIVAPRR